MGKSCRMDTDADTCQEVPSPLCEKNVKNRRPPVKNVKNVINPRPASNGLAVGDRFTSASLE